MPTISLREKDIEINALSIHSYVLHYIFSSLIPEKCLPALSSIVHLSQVIVMKAGASLLNMIKTSKMLDGAWRCFKMEEWLQVLVRFWKCLKVSEDVDIMCLKISNDVKGAKSVWMCLRCCIVTWMLASVFRLFSLFANFTGCWRCFNVVEYVGCWICWRRLQRFRGI